jgi:tol-pal system protein YbgF
MAMKRIMTLAAVASSLLLGGCFFATTKSEGQAMRRDITSLQGRVDTQEKELDTQIKQLQGVLDEATKVLKRNSADIGADVEKLATDIRTANGLVSAINNNINELKVAFDKFRSDATTRLDSLEQRIAQIESGKPSANSGPDDLWKLGTAAFEAARYNDALEIYKRLVQGFPTHARADDAQYFRGQSYTNLKDYDNAIAQYQTLVQKYPDSDLADDGLYFAGLAAQSLKNCTEARTYLGLIKSKYPKSNVLKQSTDLDATLKKDAKNKSKCSS